MKHALLWLFALVFIAWWSVILPARAVERVADPRAVFAGHGGERRRGPPDRGDHGGRPPPPPRHDDDRHGHDRHHDRDRGGSDWGWILGAAAGAAAIAGLFDDSPRSDPEYVVPVYPSYPSYVTPTTPYPYGPPPYAYPAPYPSYRLVCNPDGSNCYYSPY